MGTTHRRPDGIDLDMLQLSRDLALSNLHERGCTRVTR